jgi:hypothetical protein
MSGWDAGRWWRWAVVLTSAAVFIASLTQTACVVDNPLAPNHPSLALLIFGPFGVFEGPNILVWPFVIAAWVLACYKRRLGAVIAGLVAIGLMSVDFDAAGAAGYAAWIANPIIVTAWLLYVGDKRQAALISAVTALALTLSFLQVKELLGSPPYRGVNIPDFETVPIISYGTGYWLWVASAGILVAGVIVDTFLFRYIASGSR